ncbi:MAG: hypothetical protein VX498_00550, partial [Myxococcota bacterium]|nr:hypothetical protein [Myxococcota bacterium]
MSTLRALTPVLPWTTTLLVLGICLPLTACDFGRFGQHRTGPDTNDSEEPRDEDNLIEEPDIDELDNLWAAAELECESSSDCLSHETCIDSVCQIDRCTAAEYESLAPLGDNFLFYADLEVGIIDKQDWQDDYWVDSFSPGTATLDYDTSWNIGDQPAIDIAGGDLLGAGEELYAVILEDVADLFLLTDNGPERQGLPFVPTAIAAGDVDSDSVAEVIVVGGHEFAVCDLNLSYCQPFVLQEGIEMIDVAVGDVDGDVLREAVFLYEDENAQRMLHVANFDSEQTQQELTWTVEVEDKTYRIASGDLDGSGRAQIVGLQDGGWMNLNDDELDVYELVDLADGSELQHVLHQESGFKRLVDITVGDTNADEVAELLALDSDNKLASALLEEGEFEFAWTVEFDITGDPARIAMADRDNDSPRAILSEGPQVVPGASVPVVAMLLPPYSYESSAGFSSTGYGMAETMSETYTDTISMSIGMDVGVS